MVKEFKELIVEKRDNILVVYFNNPKKKNSLNRTAYREISEAVNEAAQDDSVSVVVFTGVGDFFTAGNDLSQGAEITDIEAYSKASNRIFKEMVRSIVDCPKILIALVNGPCIGFGTTLTGLCDLAWCSDTAYFLTPFTKLGIVPEAGSSYLFPLILGRSKATELLLFSEKMTADEALRFNFVSRVFKNAELESVIWPKIREYANLPKGSLRISKQLLRSSERDILYKAIDAECDELHKRFFDEEFANALIKFLTRKSKL